MEFKNIEALARKYGTTIDNTTGDSLCNTIDKCFHIANYAGMGDHEEEVKECKYVTGEDIAVSVAEIILCGRRIEQLFKENKFTDDPELNARVIDKVQAFLNAAEGE